MESSNSTTTEPEHIKRSPNSFMVFTSKNRKQIQILNPNASNIEVSRILGNYWSTMSDEEKNQYFETAHNLQKAHKEQYPDYKYQPQIKLRCSSTNKNNNNNHQYTYIDSNIYEISQPISNSYLNTQSFIIDNNSCLVEKTQVIQLSRENFQSNQEYLEYVVSRL
jgi:hypothetical protein